jgi:hypothetical protein
MTNIDLALKLRYAAWFPLNTDCWKDTPDDDANLRSFFIAPNLERIAWAAAVALTDKEWTFSRGQMLIDDDREKDVWYWHHHAAHDLIDGTNEGKQVQDPDPLRATLLAAVEMEGAK